MTKSSWLLLVCMGSFACQNSHELGNQDAGLDAVSVFDSQVDASAQDAASDSAIDTSRWHPLVAGYVEGLMRRASDSCFCENVFCEALQSSARFYECTGDVYTAMLANNELTSSLFECHNRLNTRLHDCVHQEASCDAERFEACYSDVANACPSFPEDSSTRVVSCVNGPPNPVCPDLASSALGNDVFALDPQGRGKEYALASFLNSPMADVTFEWTAPQTGDFLVSASRSDFATTLCAQPGMCGALDQYACIVPSGNAAMFVVHGEAGQTLFLAASFTPHVPSPNLWWVNSFQSGLIRIDIHPYQAPPCAAWDPQRAGSSFNVDTRPYKNRPICAGDTHNQHVGEWEWLAPTTGRFEFVAYPSTSALASWSGPIGLAAIRGSCAELRPETNCDQQAEEYQPLVLDVVAGETIVLRVGAPYHGAPITIDVHEVTE